MILPLQSSGVARDGVFAANHARLESHALAVAQLFRRRRASDSDFEPLPASPLDEIACRSHIAYRMFVPWHYGTYCPDQTVVMNQVRSSLPVGGRLPLIPGLRNSTFALPDLISKFSFCYEIWSEKWITCSCDNGCPPLEDVWNCDCPYTFPGERPRVGEGPGTLHPLVVEVISESQSPCGRQPCGDPGGGGSPV